VKNYGPPFLTGAKNLAHALFSNETMFFRMFVFCGASTFRSSSTMADSTTNVAESTIPTTNVTDSHKVATVAQLVAAAREPVWIDAHKMRGLVSDNEQCHRDQGGDAKEFQFFVRRIYPVAHAEGTEVLLLKPLAFRRTWIQALKELGFQVQEQGKHLFVEWVLDEPEEEDREEEEVPIKKRKRR
jgi:hypothetical protein